MLRLKGKEDLVLETAAKILRRRGFTWSAELSREAGCSWYMANKVLRRLRRWAGLKVFRAGSTKLFINPEAIMGRGGNK